MSKATETGKEAKEGVNLVALRPKRTARSTAGADGVVVVFVPKFTGRHAARWIVPLLKSPFVELKLDEIGSFFWNQCDGRSSVGEIASRMSDRFGGGVEPMLDRIAVFMRRLDESKLIDIHGSAGVAAQVDASSSDVRDAGPK